jgi:mono/diheme cytochrome c family protein
MAALAGVSAQRPASAPGAARSTSPATTAEAQAAVTRYCATCHSDRVKAGGLSLASLDLTQAGSHAATWEKVVRKVRTGMMPPSGAPRPDRATLDGLAASVERVLDRSAAAAPNAGTRALHRLNRAEYANAVRDLLDLPVDAAALLPGDDSTEGFDNIASALSVSPALMQAYVTAAARISRLAVGDPTTSSGITTYPAARGLSQAWHLENQPLGTRGGVSVVHVFPLDADYDFRVGRTASGFGLPGVGGDESIEITLDGERLRLLTGQEAARGVRLKVPAGPHAVGVAVVRKANARGVDDLWEEMAMSVGISGFSIAGPIAPTGPGDTPSRRRLFVCHPAAPAEEEPCARRILSTVAGRAFRQPVSAADPSIDALLEFYRSGHTLRGFEAGIQYALARILVDPRFVYRFEREPANVPEGTPYRVTDLELASRLSFFVWSSIPDDELLAVAAKGRLSDRAVLEQQTRRMLADPRARALVDNVGGQWLLLRQLAEVSPASREFDGNLRHAFKRETELLFESILREDRSVLDLLRADYTFVDERLARHYGIPNIRGSRFRRVALPDDTRRGLLGHGSVLTATSVGNRTSPVKRGKWILENLLGAPVPLPPPGVETNLDETAAAGSGPTSLRQRLEKHRANASCASCHAVMDPIGFALENFDLAGQWRQTDGGVPVNASGKLADGTALTGPATLRQALLARPDAFVTNTTEKFLTYALGRRVEYFDMPAVRAIVRDAAPQDYRLSALVLGIVRSTPFQMKMRASEAPPRTVEAPPR